MPAVRTYSQFRCPACGESYTINVEPVIIDPEGNVESVPEHIDVLIVELPCAACGTPLVRGDPRNDFVLDDADEDGDE